MISTMIDRKLSALVSAAAVTCLASCGIVNAPGEVSYAQDAPNPTFPDQMVPDPSRVRGSFRGVWSPVGVDAGTGGGCLVYQVADHARSCGSEAQCLIVRGVVTIPGYCDAEDPELDAGSSEGTCWYKVNPEGNSCLKGQEIVDKTFQIGPAPTYPRGPGTPVNWRVLTCQNLVNGGCGKSDGVQGVDRIHRYGKISRFPP